MIMATLDTFEKRLNHYMRVKNVNCEQLARHCDVARTTVGAWRRGEAMPRSDALRNMVEYTGISADWWLGVEA